MYFNLKKSYHVYTWSIAKTDRKTRSVKTGTFFDFCNLHITTPHHVVASSVLFNADIALRALRRKQHIKI